MTQQQYSDLDDLFAGGGAPTMKFVAIGDSITGVITGTEVRQQKDFTTDELKFWDDQKPMMELVLTLATSLRDAGIEDDDGSRRVFVRGQMLTASRQAVRKAKAKKPDIGGRITITHSGEGEASKKGFNAPKLYEVTYEPPMAVAVDDMFDDEPETVAAPAAPAPAVDTAALLAQAANLDPAALAALLADANK